MRRVAPALLLAAITCLNLFWPGSSGQRGYRLMPEMARSPAPRAYSADLLEPGRGELLEAPDRTVPRGQPVLPYSTAPGEAERAGVELSNPVPSDETVLQRGKELFRDYCTPCHGADAKGTGQVVSRGFPAPPSLLAESARGRADGYIFHLLTFGRANMPSYAGQLTRTERWTVIRFLRKFQEEAPPQ